MKISTILPRLFVTFGLLMMLTVSGWGADECSNTIDHAFTASGTDASFSNSSNDIDKYESVYYYFQVPSAGTLTFTDNAPDGDIFYQYSRSSCPSFFLVRRW